MKRDLARLAASTYDVLIIGGGISGACMAWDATLRGLKVALVERGDFGGATSSNSLKTVHGGLRYLQDGNLNLVRKMVRERRALLRIAPHLVHPLPCLLPTYRNKLLRSKLVLGTALKLNDLISFDRNSGIDPQRVLPNGRLLSESETLHMLPGLDKTHVNGGIMWYDAQMYSSERLLLSFLLSATKAGAEVANYVGVTNLLQENGSVVGVEARDCLNGKWLQISARVVVNTAGPWVDEVLGNLNGHAPQRKFHLSTAMNLITRQIFVDHAVGLSSRYTVRLPDGTSQERSRVLFVAPWRGYSLIGTLHAPFQGHAEDKWVAEQIVTDFMSEVNRAYPAADLKREDIYRVHHGFLPAVDGYDDGSEVKLVRTDQVFDHQVDDGIKGLITVVGVKYTTGRSVAQKAVDLIYKKLDRLSPPCRTSQTPLHGGHIKGFGEFLRKEIQERSHQLPSRTIRHLIHNYGSAYSQILEYFESDPSLAEPLAERSLVTKAEIVHGIRSEMAQKLADVVLRRTELGAPCRPSEKGLRQCARIMAGELGWNEERVEQEIDEVQQVYEIVT